MRKAILTVVLFGLLWPETAPEAAPPDTSRVRTSRIDSLNRTAFEAFGSRNFRTTGAAARRAWDLCGGATDDVAAGIAAANVAAALTMHGRFREALEWQNRAKAIFVRTENPGLRGRLEAARAVTDFFLSQQYSPGEPEEALADIERAEALLGADDIRTARLKGMLLCCSNDPERAQAGYRSLKRLLEEYRTGGDGSLRAVCAMHLGRIEGTSSGHRAALDYYTEALDAMRAGRDSSGTGPALRNVGLARRSLGAYAEADAAFREALDLARERGDRRLTVVVLNDLSALYTEIGEHARAQAYDREAGAALAAIAEDLRQGRTDDTVLFDFYQLLKIRYASKLLYDLDLFPGFCDQLALEPPR